MSERNTIFNQDRSVVELTESWYRLDGGEFERSVEADAPTLLVRQIIRLAETGEWERRRAALQ